MAQGTLQVQTKTDEEGVAQAVVIIIGDSTLRLTIPQAKSLAKTLVAMWENWE